MLLLLVHTVFFFYMHSKMGNGFTNMLMKSRFRVIFQETFKGYGKALNVLSAIKEAFKIGTDGVWAIVVLVIRGVASATLKQIIIFFLLRRKRFKYDKPRANFFFVSIPSVTLYIALVLIKTFADPEMVRFLEEDCVLFFMTFMVMSKFVRSFNKIVYYRSKRIKKKYKTHKKNKKLKKE